MVRSHGKTMGKPREKENHGEIMEKSWRNHGEIVFRNLCYMKICEVYILEAGVFLKISS
jgi:hypothetical protein